MPKKIKERERWYYDACALDYTGSFAEIINKKNPRQSIVSHLSLGEAYGNIYLKQGELGVLSFVGLIEKLRSFLTIVGNDGTEKQFDAIKNADFNLSITDSIHLATAIKHKCCVFKSVDGDFCGNKEKICKFVCDNFSQNVFVIAEPQSKRKN